MHKMDIKNRIDKFFDGTLTYEEEQELYLYLCSNEAPAELQGDKDAIMAMCTDINDYTLPVNARERLVQILDTLEDDACKQPCVPVNGAKKVPLFVWHCVAVAVVILYFFVVPSINIANPDNNGIAYEQDTFDNPEEAMECVRSAFGELFLAVNTTRQNALEIGNALEESAVIVDCREPKQ